MKLELPKITLIGIDCINLERLQLATEISTKDINFGKVKLLTSITSNDPRVIKIPHLDSAKKYSEFVIKKLYKYIDTEFALIFQYDGFILNASCWSNDFLEYDYIGSPWYHLGDLRVGNGGFSLRSKRLIDWLGKNWKEIDAKIHPEDVFISKFARPYLEKSGMSFAPENVAKDFSFSGGERGVFWNGEFGFHGIKYTDISKWLIDNQEYKEKLNYKLDDYFNLMRKYPVYYGTIHTFRFKKQNKKEYIKLSRNQKNYEARMMKEKYFDFSNVKIGDTVICKKSGYGFYLDIPAFEKKVINIEKFNSFSDLRKKYPKINITYPIKDIPKWKRPFLGIFGDILLPKNKPYIIFWF